VTLSAWAEAAAAAGRDPIVCWPLARTSIVKLASDLLAAAKARLKRPPIEGCNPC
jgi:hypothetical protein